MSMAWSHCAVCPQQLSQELLHQEGHQSAKEISNIIIITNTGILTQTCFPEHTGSLNPIGCSIPVLYYKLLVLSGVRSNNLDR